MICPFSRLVGFKDLLQEPLQFFAVEPELEELASRGDGEVVYEGFSMPVLMIKMHAGDGVALAPPLQHELTDAWSLRLELYRDLNGFIKLGKSALSSEHVSCFPHKVLQIAVHFNHSTPNSAPI